MSNHKTQTAQDWRCLKEIKRPINNGSGNAVVAVYSCELEDEDRPRYSLRVSVELPDTRLAPFIPVHTRSVRVYDRTIKEDKERVATDPTILSIVAALTEANEVILADAQDFMDNATDEFEDEPVAQSG